MKYIQYNILYIIACHHDLDETHPHYSFNMYLTNGIFAYLCYFSKENTVLRSGVIASKVAVIPNAIDTDLFVPDPFLFRNGPTTVIVLSRLVYRKVKFSFIS